MSANVIVVENRDQEYPFTFDDLEIGDYYVSSINKAVCKCVFVEYPKTMEKSLVYFCDISGGWCHDKVKDDRCPTTRYRKFRGTIVVE